MPDTAWFKKRVDEEAWERLCVPHPLLDRCDVCQGAGLCNVCTGESPSWDGHDRNPACVVSRHAWMAA